MLLKVKIRKKVHKLKKIQLFRRLVTAKEIQKRLGRYSIGYINRTLNPKDQKKNKIIVDCALAIIEEKKSLLLA